MSIPYDRLQMMDTFIRIVETGSISAAARDLRIAQSSVSRQLRQLEDSLGVTLITRTTHQISLTDAGRGFLPDCRRMIREWKGIEDRFRHDSVQPRGKLKIVASVGLGQFVLVEIAARYCRRYPEVEIEWNVDDGAVSVLQSGIDCLLKAGHIEEKSLVTRTVAEVRAMLVASPGLIAERGMPKSSADLAGWPMIGVHPYFTDYIAIRSHQGRSTRIRGRRRFLTSNIVVARSAALAGAGFTLLPSWLAAADIQAGSLRQLLPGWEAPPLPLSIGTPAAKHTQTKVTLFIEELVLEMKNIPGCASTLCNPPVIT